MKHKFACFLLIIVGLAVFSLTLKGVAGNPKPADIQHDLSKATKPFELSPERGRFLLTMSLAQDHSYALRQELANAASPDVGVYNGKYFVYFAPGISTLVWPAYEIGAKYNMAQLASYASLGLFALGSMILLYFIANHIGKLSTSLSLAVSFIFIFASTSLSYATTLYQHHVTTFCILLALYGTWRFKTQARMRIIWAGLVWLALGVGLFVDYSNAVLFVAPGLYFLFTALTLSRKRHRILVGIRPVFIYTAAIFLALVVLHGWYNHHYFGSWHKVSGSIVGVKDLQAQDLSKVKYTEQEVNELQANKDPIHFFKEEHMPFGLYELTIARDRGLFVFSPIFILGIMGILISLKKFQTEHAVFIGIIMTNLLFYASFADPWGGWAFGPRYLIPSMALLAYYSCVWLSKMREKNFAKAIVLVLFAYSSAVSLVGALTTNAVPPKIEADFLGMKYNFLLNADYLWHGHSSSFIYNTYLTNNLSLTNYFAILWAAIVMVFALILFILPAYEHYHYERNH